MENTTLISLKPVTLIVTRVWISTGSVMTNLGFFSYGQWEALYVHINEAMRGKYRNQDAKRIIVNGKDGLQIDGFDPKYYQQRRFK